MKQILIFGDSNTYGLIPKLGGRYPWGIRWTSILSEKLGLNRYHIVEEGLCGRTAIFDDPLRDGRCGVKSLPMLLETHAPIDLTIIMLGTNDCKAVYGASPDVIGNGISRLIGQVRRYAEKSKILIISPIHLGENIAEYDPEFSSDSIAVSRKLADFYQKASHQKNVYFLDASKFAQSSPADNEHLDEDGHRLLADAVFQEVEKIL